MQTRATIKQWMTLLVVLSATFLSILNAFSSIVAIPVIQQDLQATGAQTQLILAIYNFVFGIFLIIGGRLGDKYGRKRMFLIGIGMFTLGSLLAGLVLNANLLIMMRAVQGLGAALMIPQVLSIIQLNFSGKERGIALGAYAAVGGFASTIAQLLGGWFIFIDLFHFGWRMIYLINLPIGLLAFVLTFFVMNESTIVEARNKRVDMVGTLLVMLALLSLSVPLTFGSDLDWSLWTLVSLLLSPVFFWLFILYEQRITNHKQKIISPLVKLSLFRKKSFSLGNLLVLLFYSGNAILFLALPLLLQNGLGVSAFASGLIFTPLALGFAITSLKGGSLAARLGNRVLTIGVSLLMISYLLFFGTIRLFDSQLTGYELMLAALVAGIAMGLLSAPINFVSLQHVKEDEIGSASGILSANLELAYAIGTVLVGIIFIQFTGGSESVMNPSLRIIYFHAFYVTLGLIMLLALVMLMVIRKLSDDSSKLANKP